jgi:hypothetical protein
MRRSGEKQDRNGQQKTTHDETLPEERRLLASAYVLKQEEIISGVSLLTKVKL